MSALALAWLIPGAGASAAQAEGKPPRGVPILVYHRFGPAGTDSMTIPTARFEAQLQSCLEQGYRVIPLRQILDFYLEGKGSLPPRAVVITADDGHVSIYREFFPLMKKYLLPVTLFIYPSAISHASYAMTWSELREMKNSGLIEVQSHTFWHPNFRIEKKRLPRGEYEKFVDAQLLKSKRILEQETGGKVDLLAWPFGIYDDELMQRASQAGYRAAFTIERRDARSTDPPMALPRYLIVQGSGVRLCHPEK